MTSTEPGGHDEQLQREWFEVTLASIGDAVITCDVAGRVSYLNSVAESMTGWTLRDARGRPLADVFRIVNEDTLEPAQNPIEKVSSSSEAEDLANHNALIARDGTEISIEDSATPIRDSRGRLVGAVMVFHNVSRQRKAERLLRASEERLSAVFSQAALGIAVAGLDGRFHEANVKFCEVLGYSHEQLRTLTFNDLTHPDDAALTRTESQRLLEGAIPSYTIEKRYVRKDGLIVWSSTTVTLLRKENGDAAQFIGIIQDITDRKSDDELRARLASVVEFSDDAIITKTLNGVITTWNPGAVRVFGYTPEEALGKPVTMLIPDNHLNEEPAILERLRRGERIDHYETVRRRKDGTLINVSLTVSPVKDASGLIVGASKIARDVTRQKRAEAALREMDQRKDEFLATLAHELRNPLAPIRQATLIAQSPDAAPEQKRWSHEVVTRQVRNMSVLLDDLLDISRITRGTLDLRTEMTDLATIVDAAVETSRPSIEAKKHSLDIELPPAAVVFAADPMRLAQVLSNLLTNAAKYTDPGGHIRVRAKADPSSIEISVVDDGIGLPKESLTSVFTMFSQLKSRQDRSEGGLGIGLALAKGVVELHGGTIEAHSEGADQGSEFVVRIPRHAVPAAPGAATSADSKPQPVKRRVLIADDNRDAAASLAMLLEIDGHSVTVVNDGRQALQQIEMNPPDVALLDIGMPGLDGYQVARQVHNKQVFLVAVTGWGQESDKARATEAGFDLHFTKPVEPQQILDLLSGPVLHRPLLDQSSPAG